MKLLQGETIRTLHLPLFAKYNLIIIFYNSSNQSLQFMLVLCPLFLESLLTTEKQENHYSSRLYRSCIWFRTVPVPIYIHFFIGCMLSIIELVATLKM